MPVISAGSEADGAVGKLPERAFDRRFFLTRLLEQDRPVFPELAGLTFHDEAAIRLDLRVAVEPEPDLVDRGARSHHILRLRARLLRPETHFNTRPNSLVAKQPEHTQTGSPLGRIVAEDVVGDRAERRRRFDPRISRAAFKPHLHGRTALLQRNTIVAKPGPKLRTVSDVPYGRRRLAPVFDKRKRHLGRFRKSCV